MLCYTIIFNIHVNNHKCVMNCYILTIVCKTQNVVDHPSGYLIRKCTDTASFQDLNQRGGDCIHYMYRGEAIFYGVLLEGVWRFGLKDFSFANTAWGKANKLNQVCWYACCSLVFSLFLRQKSGLTLLEVTLYISD